MFQWDGDLNKIKDKVKGDIEDMVYHNPIHSKYVSDDEILCRFAMLTVGTESDDKIVIPLADNDCDMASATVSPVAPPPGELGLDPAEVGIFGMPPQSLKTSGARTACQGGNAGSGRIENIAIKSSPESFPV